MTQLRKRKLHSDESAKFKLFLRTREIQQITQALHQVLRLPKEQRDTWVAENGEFLAEEFESFIDSSSMTFEGLVLDDETLELSRDLVLSLREALSTVQGMLHSSEELES